jgi:hypothetical protein
MVSCCFGVMRFYAERKEAMSVDGRRWTCTVASMLQGYAETRMGKRNAGMFIPKLRAICTSRADSYNVITTSYGAAAAAAAVFPACPGIFL